MRVPYIGVPSILPQGGAPQVRVAMPTGYKELAAGIGDLAEATGDVAASAIKEHKVEEEKAAQVEARDNLTAYQTDATDVLHGTSNPTSQEAGDAAFEGRDPRTGFLATRGVDAAAARADTLDGLEEKRQKRATEIKSDRARELFLAHSAETYAATRNSVEIHVARQIQEAQGDSIKAAADEAVRAVAVDPANDQLARERINATVAPIRALATSQEDADRQALAVQSDVAAARLNALISTGDWQTAERVYSANRYQLGDRGAHFAQQIEAVKTGFAAETIAAHLVAASRRPDGSVNDRKAFDELEKVPSEMLHKVRPVLADRLREAQAAFNADTERVVTKAFAAFNNGGWRGIPDGLKEQLNQRKPEVYDRLRRESEERWRRSQGTKSQQAAEQRALNKEALNAFMTLPDEQRATQDLGTFLADYPGVDKLGASAFGPAQEAARKRIEKGESVKQGEFIADVKANAQGLVKGKEAQKAMAAEAAIAFDEFQREHKRTPTAEESAKVIGTLLEKHSTKPGLLWGTNDEFDFERRARERRERLPAGQPPGDQSPSPQASPGKFEVVGPKGARGMATEAWLAAHPDWRRK